MGYSQLVRLFLLTLALCVGVGAQNGKKSSASASREAPAAVYFESKPEFSTPSPARLPSSSSALLGSMSVPRVTLPALRAEEIQMFREGISLEQKTRVGLVRAVTLDLQRDGVWVDDPNGGDLWLVEISSVEAQMLRLHLEQFSLPPAAQLFMAAVLGTGRVLTYENQGPLNSGDFWTEDLPAETIRLELRVPKGGRASARMLLTGVGHIFSAKLEPLEAGSCNLDASCYPAWHPTRHSVAKISFVEMPYVYECSAVLLNNNSGDFSPLLLTANHCISTDGPTKSLNAYWGYRSTSCGSTSTTIAAVSTGIRLLATSPESDASLIEVHSTTLEGVPYAGWTLQSPGLGEDVVGIHNPGGFFQRISFGDASDPNPSYPSFHRVIFSAGTVEPGSSGSPLFNSGGQVLGQLYGGNASCSNPSGEARYGKLAVSYPTFVSPGGRHYLESGLPDDGFFGNQARETAWELPANADYSGLILKRNVDDWFRITVPANHKLSVSGTGNAGLQISLFPEIGEEIPNFQNWGFFFNEGQPRTFYFRTRTVSPRMYYDLKAAATAPVPPDLGLIYISPAYAPETAPGSGYIAPKGFPITVWAEWSEDPNFTTSMKSPSEYEDGRYTSRPVYFTALHIRPVTDYYFRLVSTGLTGTTLGPVYKWRSPPLRPVEIRFPANGSQNVPLKDFAAWWYCDAYCDAPAYDVYFGTTPDPPYFTTVSRSDFLAGALTGDTTYYLKVVGKFEFGTSVSSTISFRTAKHMNISWFGNPGTGPLGFMPALVVGKTSPYETAYFTNATTDLLWISGVATSGDFEVAGSCPASLAPSASCTLQARFRPTANGLRTGALTVGHQFGTAALPLSGTGVDFVLSLARPKRTSRGSAPIASLQTFALTLAAPGMEGDANLGCSGALPGMTCSVSPAAVRLNGSPVIAQVNVTTAPRSQRLRTRSTQTVVLKVHATVQGVTKTIDLPVQIEK